MYKFVTLLPKQTLHTCKFSYSEHVNFVSECLIPCYFSYLKIVWWNLNEKIMGARV